MSFVPATPPAHPNLSDSIPILESNVDWLENLDHDERLILRLVTAIIAFCFFSFLFWARSRPVVQEQKPEPQVDVPEPTRKLSFERPLAVTFDAKPRGSPRKLGPATTWHPGVFDQRPSATQSTAPVEAPNYMDFVNSMIAYDLKERAGLRKELAELKDRIPDKADIQIVQESVTRAQEEANAYAYRVQVKDKVEGFYLHLNDLCQFLASPPYSKARVVNIRKIPWPQLLITEDVLTKDYGIERTSSQLSEFERYLAANKVKYAGHVLTFELYLGLLQKAFEPEEWHRKDVSRWTLDEDMRMTIETKRRTVFSAVQSYMARLRVRNLVAVEHIDNSEE